MKYSSCFLTLLFAFISCQHNAIKKADDLKQNVIQNIELKDFSRAIDQAKEALTIYKTNSHTLGIIQTNYLIARASALSGDLVSALKYGKKAGKMIRTKENYSLEYKINNLLNYAYSTLGIDFKENLATQNRQVFVVAQLNDDEAKAMVYNNYAYDATVSGTLPIDSLINYSKFANNYYAKTENNKGRWYTLMNLTWQYRLKNDLEKSEKYGYLSVAQAESDNDRHAIIETNTNLGETLLEQDKIEAARPLYERGLEISKQEVDRDKYVFDVYYSKFLWVTGSKEEAIGLLKKAIYFLKTDEIFYEMLARAYLADFSFQMKNFDESTKQVTFFKNPRAEFYSLETKIMANMVEAQLLGRKNTEAAHKLLKTSYSELKAADASLYKYKILDLIKDIKE
jgi:tetratricopeptide (TPR) repeat protein